MWILKSAFHSDKQGCRNRRTLRKTFTRKRADKGGGGAHGVCVFELHLLEVFCAGFWCQVLVCTFMMAPVQTRKSQWSGKLCSIIRFAFRFFSVFELFLFTITRYRFAFLRRLEISGLSHKGPRICMSIVIAVKFVWCRVVSAASHLVRSVRLGHHRTQNCVEQIDTPDFHCVCAVLLG